MVIKILRGGEKGGRRADLETEKKRRERKEEVSMFGEFVREKRIAKDISLRKFCQQIGWDASNWSKTERGLLGPPQDDEILTRIADVLGIVKESTEWIEMMDLARISANKLPDDISADTRVMNSLPLFFRTLRSDKPTREELERLIELIKQER